MIEKSLEANIISAIQALNLAGLSVRGMWQPVASGNVAGEEDASSPAALVVRVSPRGFDTFGVSVASFTVTMSLVMRVDLCPTGTAIETFAEPIAALLQKWNLTLNCANDCGLGVDGEFVPGGIQVPSGDGPTFDEESCVWSVIFSFTVRGAVVEAEPETVTTNT